MGPIILALITIGTVRLACYILHQAMSGVDDWLTLRGKKEASQPDQTSAARSMS